jgi:hypothetical protein
MKYTQKKFSIAVGAHKMPDLLYSLRVGNISEAEYERLTKEQQHNRRRDRKTETEASKQAV